MIIMAKHILVKGIVQGVGYRPFVYGLATRLGLHGWVCTTSGGVEILVDGQNRHVDHFIQALSREKPSLAKIDSLEVSEVSTISLSTFEIREAQDLQGAYQPLPPDIALCPDCERELFNPKAR